MSGKMEDLLGTGTVLKQVLQAGDSAGDTDMEAPRKFFALIDIQTKLANTDVDASNPSSSNENAIIESESHKDFLITVDADLFSGAHLVLPLMNINETARFVLDSKFCYGSAGNLPHILPDAKLECVIKLKSRIPHEEFVENHLGDAQLFTYKQRLVLVGRKRERGNFWYSRGEYQNAITVYESAKLVLKETVPIDDYEELMAKFPSLFGTEAENNSFSGDERERLEIVKSLVTIRNNLAQTYIKVDELKKALKNIDKVLQLDPTNTKALFRRATIESQNNRNRDALKTLQLILSSDPSNKPVQAMLVQVKDKAQFEADRERGMYKRMFS